MLLLLFSLPIYGQVTTVAIDNPQSGQTYSGTQVFGGWVVDSASQIAQIVIELDGIYAGKAPYGGNR